MTTLLLRAARPLCAIYAAALFVATHIPVAQLPPLHTSDKLLHFGAYAIFGLLLAAAWDPGRAPARRALMSALGALALFAALDELLQIPVGRHGDPWDWLADVAGAAAGLIAARALLARWRARATGDRGALDR